jgi:hypothetical protein
MTVKYSIATAVLVLLFASASHAQTPAGRWEVLAITGDQPAQVNAGTPMTFDTTVTCIDQLCGAHNMYSHDTSICDDVRNGNVSSGLGFNTNETVLQFGVAGQYQDVNNFFIYTFVGQLIETSTTNGPLSSVISATITGKYGSTPGGCNNGIASGQGLFIARWYPPLNVALLGELTPADKSGTPIGMQLDLTQSPEGNLTGRIETGTISENRRTGVPIIEPSKSSCFSSASLEIVGTTLNPSAAIGHTFQIYAVDSVGNNLTLNGAATQPASNDVYSVDYEIVGGACTGETGTDATFRLPAAPLHRTTPRPRDPLR